MSQLAVNADLLLGGQVVPNQLFKRFNVPPKKRPQTRFVVRVQRLKFLTASRTELPKRLEALF